MTGGYQTLWPLLSSPRPGALPPPIGVPRDPLPPWDTDTIDAESGAPLPVYTELREAPPSQADVSWWRGDAWGMTIPGLPIVPGGAESGGAAARVLTYFLGRYDRAAGTTSSRTWEKKILQQQRDNLYTHISLSPQDEFANGMSEDDYVAMSVRCKQAGLYCHHLLRSKYYTPAADASVASATVTGARSIPPKLRDATLNYLKERIRIAPRPELAAATPVLDEPNALVERLHREGAIDVLTPAWEMNFWSPDAVRAMINHDAALIRSLGAPRPLLMLHFYPHYIAWPPNNEDSASFWVKNHGLVDGLIYQCDPYWSAGMMAARIQDGLDRLAPGGMYGLGLSGCPDPVTGAPDHPIWYVCWETVATVQYNNLNDGDGRQSDEDTGNVKGWECTCAPGLMTVRGFGNGARRAEGTAL